MAEGKKKGLVEETREEIKQKVEEYKDVEAVYKRIEEYKKNGEYIKAEDTYKNLLKYNVEVAEKLKKLENERLNLTQENLDIIKSAANLEFGDAFYNWLDKGKRGLEKATKEGLMLIGRTEEAAEKTAKKIPRIISGGVEAFFTITDKNIIELIRGNREDAIKELADSFIRGATRGLDEKTKLMLEDLETVAKIEEKAEETTQQTVKKAKKEIQKIHYDANAGILVSEQEHAKHLKELQEADVKTRAEAYKKGIIQQKNALAEGVITKEQYANIEERATILYLENEIALRKTYGGDTLDLENQLADMRIAIKEREAAEAEAIRKKEAADAEAARQAEQKRIEAAIKKQQEYIKGLGKDIGYLGEQISTPWLSTALDGLGNAFEKFSHKFKKKTEENTEAAKDGAEAQGDIWDGLAADIESYSEILVSMTGTLFAKQNEMLDQEIEAAKEKYEALSQKYDEAVEKRKESDEELQSLEEQAKNARGGRLLHIQSQIDAEMAKNKQLADQEKKLQSDKDKAQKDIEKKQKQQKKNELKQQLVTSIANVAVGSAKAMAQWGFPIGIINAAILAAAGAIQVATISKQMSKLEDGGLLRGRRHRDGGMPILGSNIEVEGGEYVVNRDSTAKNLGLIRYINSQRRELGAEDISSYFARPLGLPAFSSPFSHMMEQGGQVPILQMGNDVDTKILQAIERINFQPRVAVTDIHTVQGQMAQVDEWVGM